MSSNERGERAPDEAILEAAELAVQFSKRKNATRAPVHIGEIKDISKPTGAKPDLVYVHRGRTLQLRRDQARLARITEGRIEDRRREPGMERQLCRPGM